MADPSDQSQLPTTDEFFGGPKPLPTTDEFFRPPPSLADYAGAINDEDLNISTLGTTLDAFGQGAKDAWGARPLGLDEDTVKTLRQYGVFNDYETGRKTLMRSFNEELIRGGAAAIDATFRTVSAGIRGISEVATLAGVPRDLTPEAMFEAFPLGHLTGFPARPGLTPTIGTAALDRVVPPTVAKAADLGVIGKGEAGWRGQPPPPDALMPAAETRPPDISTSEAPSAVRDVHAAAREIAPEVFNEYDPLAAQRDTLRGMLDDLTEQRGRGTSPEIAALDREIEQLRTTRLEAAPAERANLANQVTALETRRAGLVDELEKPGDPPAIARVRADLQTIDYRMRDLAPQVSAAYRQAAGGEVLRAPEAPPAAPAVPVTPAAEPTTPAGTAGALNDGDVFTTKSGDQITLVKSGEGFQLKTAATLSRPFTAEGAARVLEEEGAVRAARPATAEPAAPPLPGGIAGDVEKKAIAAGMAADEARATGAVWQAYYDTRASRFGGARGTGEDLYREEAPDIVGGRGVGRVGELARELGQQPIPSGPLGIDPRERGLTVLDILSPETSAQRTNSRGVEDIAGELQTRGQQALRALGVRGGEISSPNPRTDEILSRAIAAEVKDAAQRSGHAMDWYTGSVREALRIASLIYPELATDINARTAFTAALAITSQGERVVSNVRLANRAYERFKQTGRFPTDLDVKATAINENLGKFNTFLERLGPDGLREFLSEEMTVRELEQATGINISGENKGTRVYGSAIFGPKIGQGFFQNLNGNYTPVTMDLWFMRAWGRLTGRLTGMSEAAVAAQRSRLEVAMTDAGMQVPQTMAALDRRAAAIVSQHESDFRQYRAEYNTGTRTKSELVYAAERFQKGRGGINEQPSSGGMRDWIRERVNRARELLAGEGVSVTNADLQALWWYPEKDLYAKLGGRDSEGLNVDYATAFRDLAKQRGLSDADIGGTGAVGSLERRSGPAGEADVGGGVEAGGGRGGAVVGEDTRPQAEPGTAAQGAAPELEQARRGKIRLASESVPRAVITLFRSADASTLIHESGHAWLEDLMTDAAHPLGTDELRADATTVRKWLGVKEGEPIPTAAHEKFARGFERYMMEGHAPSAELAGVFARFRDWLIQIYQTVDRLRAPINDDIRSVFDRMLSRRDEGSVVAPEREPAETFADLHEGDATHTPPHLAGTAADSARAERDAVMSAAHPEINDERLAAVSPTEAGGGAAGRGLPGAGGAAGGADTAPAGGIPQRGAVGAGRGGAAPQGTRTPAPAEPNAPLGPADTRLIDKAGNIRLDNLNAPEDVEQAIRDAAERNADFTGERRGVVSDGQLLELADALGKDPSFLDEKKIGAAFNAEEVLAARQLLVQHAAVVRQAMAAATAGGEAELVALAQEIARHEMIQGKVAQATAEWGRAGRAFRSLEGWEEVRDLNQLLKDNTGRDLNQLRQMAQLGSRLTTPGQVSKLIADSSGGKLRRAVIYYWVNTLISGPITHLTYSVGNAVNALWTPLIETPLAATSGAVRAAIGVKDADRVYFHEATAQLYGLGKGFRDGIGAAVEAFKSGVSPPLPGERIPAQFLTPTESPIPGVVGTAVGVPGRSVTAIHSFFKTIRYEQNIAALAVRDALNQGLEGDARDLRVAQMTASPTEAMMESAVGDALKDLYMRRQPYNSPGAYLARTTNSWLPAKILSPFVKIGSEIVRNAFVERTPLGIGSAEVRGKLFPSEEARGAEFDKQIGKIMAGTGLMAATVLGVLEGNITGDGPSDPGERRTWLLNHKPNSISVGPIRFSYARLGHLAMLTRFAANMTETSQRWDDEDGPKLAHSFFDGITRSVLDETWMKGVKDVFDAIYHPDENFDSWVTRFVAQWTPYSIGLGQVARLVDPYQRETRDLSTASEILNQLKAHTPLWSQTLPPRRDMFGEPITTGSGTFDRYANDAVVKRMDDLHIGIAQVDRKIRGVPLNQQQYDDYQRIAGRMAKLELDAIVGSGPAFGMMPPETQIKSIKEIVSRARESAATLIMMQSYGSENDIMKKAIDSKDAALHGASPLEVREKLKAR